MGHQPLSGKLGLLHPTHTIFTHRIRGASRAFGPLLAFFSHPASALLCTLSANEPRPTTVDTSSNFVDVCVVLTGLVVTGTIILVAFHGERLLKPWCTLDSF